MSSAKIPKADCPSETSRKETFVYLITSTKCGSPLLTPGHVTTHGPLLFGLWRFVMKAGCRSSAHQQNFWDRSLSFTPHSITWSTTTPWELLIGATTAKANSICCPQRTAIE